MPLVSDSLPSLIDDPHSVHRCCPLPLSYVLHPFLFSFRAMWKLPITRNRSANGWIWTWKTMQNTGALNKGHTEMWLNVSAGHKRPPQDQCNYERFTWTTFQTWEWLATEGGGGCCQHYVPPTEPPFDKTSREQARSSSCLPSVAIIDKGKERQNERKEVL